MHMLLQNKLGAFGVLLSDALETASGDTSPSAAALLLTFFYGPKTTVTQAAEITGISQPTAVRVLDGLVRRGFIERKGRKGRSAVLRLTAVGRKAAKSLQNARLHAMGNVLRVLPRRECAVFERTLDNLLVAATHSRAFARTTCRLCDHETCRGRLCPIGTRATEIERQVRA